MRIEPITPAIISAFVPTMDNRAELESVAGMGAEAAITATVDRSEHTFAGVGADGPIFIGGVMPMDGYGRVWMLANNGVSRYRKFYLRETRAQVDHMLDSFDVLQTVVDASYSRSIRWLRWLGFKIGEAYWDHGVMVHFVEKRR